MSLFRRFHNGKYSTRLRSLQEVNRAMEYRAQLRRLVRALWNDEITFARFQLLMTAVVAAGITRAWKMGALDAGILDGELTPGELDGIASMIQKEEKFITGLATFVVTNSKVNFGRLSVVFGRTKSWEKRFVDARNQGKLKAQSDPKLEWVLGKTEKSCKSCLALDGKVKRASVWDTLGYAPQQPPNPVLECAGWNCDCTLDVTDKKLSRGPLPRL